MSRPVENTHCGPELKWKLPLAPAQANHGGQGGDAAAVMSPSLPLLLYPSDLHTPLPTLEELEGELEEGAGGSSQDLGGITVLAS